MIASPQLEETHLVIIPSYNSGPLLAKTIRDVLEEWKPVWIVLDGSTDSSVAEAHELSRQLQSVPWAVRFLLTIILTQAIFR